MDEDGDYFGVQRKTQKKNFEKEEEERLAREQELRIQKEIEEKEAALKKKKNSKKNEDDEELNSQDHREVSQKQSLLSKKSKKQVDTEKESEEMKKNQLKPPELIEQEIGKPYFLVPEEAPMEINKDLVFRDDNKVRRWYVFINEIRLENLQKEVLSVFLNFRIGVLGKTAIKHKDVSSSEIFFKSEICKDLKRSEVKVIKVMFNCEMNLSYQMLKERKFVIEIWEYRRFRLNLFLGKIEVSLLSIASGNIKRQDDIKKAFGEKRQFARIHYNILFQEIWDYKLTFEAWKGSNILADEGGDHEPKIRLTMMTEEILKPQVESDGGKKTKNPNFKDLKGFMHFRGTLEQLTQQMIKVTLYKDSIFILAEKLVSMRGIQDTNYLKVLFRLKLKKPPQKPANFKKAQTKKKKKTAKKKLEDVDDMDDDDDEDDEALQDESHYAIVEGRVNLNKQPRYSQNGELNTYIPEEYYLVVTINRLNNVISPDDRGVINTFLTVSWRDQAKTTRMIKNDPNPTYNEELYFRIPILKGTLSLEDRLNNKTEASLIVDALKEELKTRPDITIQLWLDGQDIMSDESLGYCRVFISEIQKASKFKKSLLTDENRKYQFDTREATFTRKFDSGLFNVGHIQITFQLYFAPDLPEELDLSEFCEIPPELYPFQIQEQMNIKRDHEENSEYKFWDQKIRENFQSIGLEKTAYNIFFKNIFVRDQFNYYHLICKYLEKFYVKFQSQEATRELFAIPLDIRLSSLEEMRHFVSNIPYIQDSFSKNEVWRSPDFLLKVRKGFIHDHAVLCACLFMGYEEEDKLYASVKNYVPFEQRVFVCLGTLKHNKAFHAWVMVYSHDLKDVTFYDVLEDKQFELKDRVRNTQIGNLRRLLYSEKPKTKLEKGFLKGLAQQEDKKLTKRQQMKLEQQRKAEAQRLKEEQAKKLEEEIRRKQNEEKAAEFVKARQVARFQEDDVDNADDEKVPLAQFQEEKATVKIKNKRQQGINEHEHHEEDNDNSNQQTIFSKKSTKVDKHKKEEKTASTGPKTFFQNPFMKKFRETTPQVSAIAQREAQEDKKWAQNPTAKFEAVAKFPGQENVKIDLPYASVELIFNQKNIFGNLANQNPAAIFYHLHKNSEWKPFIWHIRNVDSEPEISDDQDELISDNEQFEPTPEERKQWEEDGFKRLTWTQKVGSFYSAQILKEPIKKNRVKRLLEDIFMEVYAGIEKARGKLSLHTKWKHEGDGLNKKMIQYMKILEYQSTKRPIKIVHKKEEQMIDGQLVKWNDIYESYDYEYIMEEWRKEVKILLPLNFHLSILPMRFTYTESEKIRSVIVENMAPFYMRKEKRIIFNLAGKIFNYPNRINCVRLILGCTYSQADEEQPNKDEEDEQNQEEPQIQVENDQILEDIHQEDEREALLEKQQPQEII